MLSAPEAVVERRITVWRRQQLSFFCVCYSGVARHGHWRRQCSFEEATAKTILMGEHLHPHCQPLNEKGEKWLFTSSRSRRWPALVFKGKEWLLWLSRHTEMRNVSPGQPTITLLSLSLLYVKDQKKLPVFLTEVWFFSLFNEFWWMIKNHI